MSVLFTIIARFHEPLLGVPESHPACLLRYGQQDCIKKGMLEYSKAEAKWARQSLFEKDLSRYRGQAG